MSRRIRLAFFRLVPVALLLAFLMAWAPASSPAMAADVSVIRVVQLVNYERARYGLRPLAINYALMGSAQSYAEVMASSRCFGHYCGRVPSADDRARRAGYTGQYYIGENVAYGLSSPEGVVQMWMGSYYHRAAILSPRFNEIGVGLAWSGYTPYWVQNFGTG
jgi:uncharacterized protein YkwD